MKDHHATLTVLAEKWRAREMALCRKADAQTTTQYAQRLAAEAEGMARCADELEATLRSLAAAPEGQTGWRSMEAAPKDGTEVLISDGSAVWCSRWVESAWYEVNNDPTDSWGRPLYEGEVVAWMPMPTPVKRPE
jgi:hypothetical protein